MARSSRDIFLSWSCVSFRRFGARFRWLSGVAASAPRFPARSRAGVPPPASLRAAGDAAGSGAGSWSSLARSATSSAGVSMKLPGGRAVSRAAPRAGAGPGRAGAGAAPDFGDVGVEVGAFDEHLHGVRDAACPISTG